MLTTYLSQIEFPLGAHILDVGCGTGALCRRLSTYPGVSKIVGLDPSPIFIKRAKELSKDLSNISYEEGDGRNLPYENDSFDILLFHTVLCHNEYLNKIKVAPV